MNHSDNITRERMAFAAWLAESIRALPITEAEFCRRHGLYRGYLNAIKKGRMLAGQAYMDRVIKAMADENKLQP